MAEGTELARPVMGRSASFQPNQTQRKRGKEGENLPSSQLSPKAHGAISGNSVHLKHVLGQIESNDSNLIHHLLLDVTPS
jgi:hypothetical protein